MSIIYRTQRGNLEESMKGAITFNSEKMMKEFIVNSHNEYMDTIGCNAIETHITVNDVVIDDKVTNDDRIGWEDTRYVCLKKGYGKDYMKEYGCPQAIGYCATIFPETRKIKCNGGHSTITKVNKPINITEPPKSFKASTINIIKETWWKAFPYAIRKYTHEGRSIVAVGDSKEDLDPTEFADDADKHPKLIGNPNYDPFERMRFAEALKGNDVFV